MLAPFCPTVAIAVMVPISVVVSVSVPVVVTVVLIVTVRIVAAAVVLPISGPVVMVLIVTVVMAAVMVPIAIMVASMVIRRDKRRQGETRCHCEHGLKKTLHINLPPLIACPTKGNKEDTLGNVSCLPRNKCIEIQIHTFTQRDRLRARNSQ
jgi:hypothetical protein